MYVLMFANTPLLTLKCQLIVVLINSKSISNLCEIMIKGYSKLSCCESIWSILFLWEVSIIFEYKLYWKSNCQALKRKFVLKFQILKFSFLKAELSSLGRSGSFDCTRITWPRIAASFDATGERSPCTDQGKGRSCLAQGLHIKSNDYPTLKNQPESLIYAAISLISMDDSSFKLTWNGKSNKLFLYLARDEHWQKSG